MNIRYLVFQNSKYKYLPEHNKKVIKVLRTLFSARKVPFDEEEL